MQNLRLPNFIIIGAAKSGTTALYHYLKQHPEVYLSAVKETRYFAFNEQGVLEGFRSEVVDDVDLVNTSIRNLDDYQILFKGATDQKAIGEISPIYLVSPKAPERIRKLIPEVKLIAILRNPIDRAYSAFIHAVRDGRESQIDLATCNMKDVKKIVESWREKGNIIGEGYYFQHLSRYFRMFESNNIKVVLYDDLKLDTQDLLKELFSFLEISHDFVPDTSSLHNVGGIPKNALLYSLLKKSFFPKYLLKKFLSDEHYQVLFNSIRNMNLVKSPSLTEEFRKEISQIYLEDIGHLQKLLDRDLSHWLK